MEETTFRLDLLQWRQKKLGVNYQEVADMCGVSLNAAYRTLTGKVQPKPKTITAIFRGMGLDPKYALDFSLQEHQFRRAVVATAR